MPRSFSRPCGRELVGWEAIRAVRWRREALPLASHLYLAHISLAREPESIGLRGEERDDKRREGEHVPPHPFERLEAYDKGVSLIGRRGEVPRGSAVIVHCHDEGESEEEDGERGPPGALQDGAPPASPEPCGVRAVGDDDGKPRVWADAEHAVEQLSELVGGRGGGGHG